MGKIYTKTGDKGKTSLFNGQRVSKNNPRVNAYGTVDELNSLLGLVLAEIQSLHSVILGRSKATTPESRKDPGQARMTILNLQSELIAIQKDLLTIGSILANPTMNHERITMNYLNERVAKFEHLIDQMTDKMPLLTNFILPGGGRLGSMLHLARTVARRTERTIVGLSEEMEVPQEIIIYFNRLSDLLFTMARWVNFKEKKKEEIWVSWAKASDTKSKR